MIDAPAIVYSKTTQYAIAYNRIAVGEHSVPRGNQPPDDSVAMGGGFDCGDNKLVDWFYYWQSCCFAAEESERTMITLLPTQWKGERN